MQKYAKICKTNNRSCASIWEISCTLPTEFVKGLSKKTHQCILVLIRYDYVF